MADQEFLASFGVEVDEAGVARLQAVLEENRALADSLAAAFQAASAALRSFAEELGALPGFSGRGVVTEALSGFGGLSLGLDLSQAFSDYEAFAALVKQPVSLKANAAGITSAARSALSSVQSIFSAPVTVRVRAEPDAAGPESGTQEAGAAAAGGTDFLMPAGKAGVSSPEPLSGNAGTGGTNSPEPLSGNAGTEAAGAGTAPESLRAALPDGMPEFILRQSGFSAVLPGEGLQAAAEALLPGGLLAGQVPEETVRTVQNISVPVSIQVQASGADPEAVGKSVYSMAERYLLKTLRSAVG